jgi:OFA family oxalate/formate antiporter-like MFS transporter
MLYTAKGAGSLLVPVAAIIAKNHGWGAVFSVGMSFNIIAALLALFVLKPMRVRHFVKSRIDFPPAAASADATRTA